MRRKEEMLSWRAGIWYLLFAILALLIISACGDESPFESEHSAPNIPLGALSAVDFPAADGNSWTYVSADGEHTYTSRISGTKILSGLAVRVMENRLDITSDIPLEEPVDYFSALFGVPIYESLFTKDVDSYTEHAFELWIPFLGDTIFQRNSPKRILWSFPLYVGKEWVVQETRLDPKIRYVRKVVSDKGVLSVPADTYEEVYYVEEYVSIAGIQTGEESPNKYWLAPNVGVVKYEYVDPAYSTTQTYELSDFRK